MFSSLYSVWTTENPLMRSRGSRSRSLKSNLVWRTKPRKRGICPWWSVVTRMIMVNSIAKWVLMKLRSLSPVMRTVLTLKSQQRRTPTWMRCSMFFSAWPNYPMKWAQLFIGRSLCSMAILSTKSHSGCIGSKRQMPMAWFPPLLVDPVSTVIWNI